MRTNLLYKNKYLELKKLDEFDENLISDLELNELILKASDNDPYISKLFKNIILQPLTNKEDIIYRQDVYKDLKENYNLILEFQKYLFEMIIEIKQKFPYLINTKSPFTISTSVTSIIQYIVPKLYTVRNFISSFNRFNSEGIKLFKENNLAELTDDNLNMLMGISVGLDVRKGTMASASLNEDMEIANYEINQSTYLEKAFKKKWKKAEKIEYGYLSETIYNEIMKKNDVCSMLYVDEYGSCCNNIINFISDLYDELSFYIAGINLEKYLNELNLDTVIPNVGDLCYEGLYDMAIAIKKKGEVVANNHKSSSKMWVITGANQGGKTTFLRSLGQAYLFMQAGIFVPAKALTLPMVSKIFTHFDKEEDTNLESGKFDDELRRFNNLIDKLDDRSLIILNESFQSTDEHEGSKIGFEIIKAFRDSNVFVILVTHMYDLAMLIKKEYSDCYFLRAERKDDGSRTFVLKENEPLKTSFAIDLYNDIWKEREN